MLLVAIFEDNSADIRLLHSLFEELGMEYQIIQVEGKNQLLELLENWKLIVNDRKLIILDLITALENGLDVLAHINAHPTFKSQTLVVWTSMTNQANIAIAYQLGANLYIFKSSSYDEMFIKWKKILRFLRLYP